MSIRRLRVTVPVIAALCLAPFGLTHHAMAQSCVAAASAIAFGSVSPIRNAAINATGAVTVTCTWPAVTLVPNAQVCLNLSAASPRTMINGANTLSYDLYGDAARTVSWGASTTGGTPISLTLIKPVVGTVANASVTVYGQVFAGQPTVPTLNNGSTAYTQTFSAAQTSLNVGFYLLGAPTCASLTASSGTFPFTASATVINDCIMTATNMTFATTSILNNPVNATSGLTVQCTNNDAYRIAFSGGGSGNALARTMLRTGGGTVAYQLYTDAGRTLIWGDGTGGTVANLGTGSGLQQLISVYGQVSAQTTAIPGNYSDNITATISF
jgi:spore coat protein U-like protein